MINILLENLYKCWIIIMYQYLELLFLLGAFDLKLPKWEKIIKLKFL